MFNIFFFHKNGIKLRKNFYYKFFIKSSIKYLGRYFSLIQILNENSVGDKNINITIKILIEHIKLLIIDILLVLESLSSLIRFKILITLTINGTTPIKQK
ncbi:hypothetical protein A0H76_837 [Hepatospora eriocheir]|uniref:Uncharacterized protein n=1 Tax=Hepatospora eriocheir TaxID=1081669 RepID=A0A1X0Q6K7_9MICR|nr:hypothetical protein A0H76_837 [Hepatospora eriocheir]